MVWLSKLKKFSAVILATLMAFSGALADEIAPNRHTGFYVGAGIGGITNIDLFTDESGFGLGFNLGYMINPYVGLEVLYYLNPYYANSTAWTFFFNNINYSALNQIYGGDIKLNLPLGKNFGIFAKGGYGGVTSSVKTDTAYTIIFDGSESGPLIGGGLSYSFGNHSELSLESDVVILVNSDAGDSYGFFGLVYNYHFS
jgi:hypothetical protein